MIGQIMSFVRLTLSTSGNFVRYPKKFYLVKLYRRLKLDKKLYKF